MIYKEFVECKLCNREMLKESFNRHLATHYNPLSRNCNKWYRKYFKKDQGVCTCVIDDTEFYPDVTDGYDGGEQYIKHLNQLNIQN